MRNNRNKTNNRTRTRQTDQPTGCLSGFFIPMLIVLLIGLILAANTTTFDNLHISNSLQNPKLAGLFTPEIHYWSDYITRWAKDHQLDPNLVATVMQIESCGNPDSLSGAGAAGLFQVMPFHFNTDENSFDPETNALRGLTYLAKSMESAHGDYRLGLAGYNGGIAIMEQPESNWADETIRYVYWGAGIYSDAQQNLSTSTRLEEWLNAGGKMLCDSANQKLGISK